MTLEQTIEVAKILQELYDNGVKDGELNQYQQTSVEEAGERMMEIFKAVIGESN
jgi:hypothetical protein